jgi:redox-sensitive bicupin YhaK (pirin superfamily)
VIDKTRQESTCQLITRFGRPQSARHEIPTARYAWLQVARGRVVVNGELLTSGDAAAFTTGGSLELSSKDDAEVLLFDLA